ncbi:MAG: hypothetical protein SOR72_07875 [Hornefia sp.]|nr:hypothetical protein [Hornefia sp.]
MDNQQYSNTVEKIDEREERKKELVDSGRFHEMVSLLEKHGLEFYDDEVQDYVQMFDVIGELCEKVVTWQDSVPAFAKLVAILNDESLACGRAKMKAMYEELDSLGETKGKLDRKGKLFFSFSVYAACSVISEKDDKKHFFIGMPEFESPEYIKHKMEEYWAIDPYMFNFAF